MGNIDSLRDWGHAKDYVKMQWMMLQQDEPHDFVIATGLQYTVREFIIWSAAELGITLQFSGTGAEEVATVVGISGSDAPGVKVGNVVVRINHTYFHPAEVETLLGDPTKAKELPGWVPEITAQERWCRNGPSGLGGGQKLALLNASGYSLQMAVE